VVGGLGVTRRRRGWLVVNCELICFDLRYILEIYQSIRSECHEKEQSCLFSGKQ